MAWNPTYKINLLKTFDDAYSSSSEELRSKLRPVLSQSDFKQVYGSKVVDRIVERTLDNKDKNGKTLGVYSKSYKESLVFQIYNKSNPVNLQLTGEMLSSLESVSSRYSITIQLADEENKAKAHGHINGLMGKARKRDFLGLPSGEEQAILKETIRQYRDASLELAADLL